MTRSAPQPHFRGTARFRLPTGEERTLYHGDIIGRLWSAALHLPDARVSECHAMVSLRGRDFKLLPLRGRFLVDGKAIPDASLRPGMVVTIAPGLDLEVVEVTTPTDVLAIEADGLPQRVLTGVISLFGGPHPQIKPGWDAKADGHLWPDGHQWMRSTEPPTPLIAGDRWVLDGIEFRATLQSGTAGMVPTTAQGAMSAPLKLLIRYDSVHFLREDSPVIVLSGRGARLISELALIGLPVRWDSLALQLWDDEEDPEALRARWDMLLNRLRRKLRDASIRTNLVQADGNGLLTLVLGPHDTVVDET